MCSVDFYHFFLNRNSLKAFTTSFWKFWKNWFFLKKHAGFARTLKMFFDFNVAHLKMTYRLSGITNTTYIVIKHFSNTEKNIFLKFWNNCTHVAHFFMFHHFGKMEVLQKFRPSNFYSIFVASWFCNIIFTFFVFSMFELSASQTASPKRTRSVFCEKKKVYRENR